MIALAVFDVAGTTVAVTDGVPEAFRGAFAAVGIPLSDEDVRGVRGISKRDAVRALLEARETGPVDDGRVEAVLQDFRARLRRTYDGQAIEPLPDAVRALRALRSRGVAVWLTTGFDGELARLVVERAGLAGEIDGLVTDDDVARGRPAPDLIHAAMAGSGVADPSRVLVVGDTVSDLDSAAAAGVELAVGVLTGAHGRERLESRPHDLIVEDLSGLLAELEAGGWVAG